ncbi:serine kinase [Maribellus comscasis]|uniref:Serine kinase n=1 Tax=Maribellus comscasis TaxID=2681766 RepID=A0A6I6JZT7_9BACT|nr:DRTGG domain-containing protein [Maribellus comscasis]QGY45672.1 serine kinase [Maribellus comscasis]
MKVSDLVEKFNLIVFSGNNGLENEISGGYVSDLLSDVMGNAGEGEVWITLQTHQNVLAIASLKDLPAVILVKGFEPEAETLNKSNEEGIPILGTRWGTFETAGKLYNFLQED